MAPQVEAPVHDERSWLENTKRSTTLTARNSSQTAQSSGLCFALDAGKIVIDRKILIVALCIFTFITIVSIIGIATLLYREWARRRQTNEAKVWGRKSHVEQRISLMRKEIDSQYSRQYSGCLHQEPENPEMGSDSPVEMMFDDRVWEAPAIPARAADKNKRKSNVFSLFFNEGTGLWLPKQ